MQTANVNAREMLNRHAIRESLCPQVVKFCRLRKFMHAKVNHEKDNADESLCPLGMSWVNISSHPIRHIILTLIPNVAYHIIASTESCL